MGNHCTKYEHSTSEKMKEMFAFRTVRHILTYLALALHPKAIAGDWKFCCNLHIMAIIVQNVNILNQNMKEDSLRVADSYSMIFHGNVVIRRPIMVL